MTDFHAQGPNTIHTTTNLSKFSYFEPRDRKQHSSKDQQGFNSPTNLSQYLEYNSLQVLDYHDSLLQVHSGTRSLVEENPRGKQEIEISCASKVWSSSKIPTACSSLYRVSAQHTSSRKTWPTSNTTRTFEASTTYGLQAINNFSWCPEDYQEQTQAWLDNQSATW